jgi:hypothetical protein
MSARFIAGVLVAAVMWAPTLASAQTSSNPPPASGWREGFVLQSDGGDYRLQFNVLVQADGRFALPTTVAPDATSACR